MSNTKTISKHDADQVIYLTVDYIAEWTQSQLAEMVDKDRLPVCLPLESGGYLIGHDKLVAERKFWQRYNRNNEKCEIFPDRQTAIFYSLCSQLGHPKKATMLKALSRNVIKLKTDLEFYKNALNQAVTRRDDFSIGLYHAKYKNSMLQLQHTEEHLRKTVKSAKYIKLWEHNHAT